MPTPGVTIEEVSLLPPSVAQVATAVPAFIGYTKKHKTAGEVEVAVINNLLEFEERFGRMSGFKIGLDNVLKVDTTEIKDGDLPVWPLGYALSLYFSNGGGRCYVISIGGHDSTPAVKDFEAGLERLKAEDEPTLVVMPDLVQLKGSADPVNADFHKVCQAALKHCKDLGDRFAILDLPANTVTTGTTGATIKDFRDSIGTDALDYGAAYHPYLRTPLLHCTRDDDVTVVLSEQSSDSDGGSGGATEETALLSKIRYDHSERYNKIKAMLAGLRVSLPPSAAIAGAYASVDRDRGVWKAPANVSLASVIGPKERIDNKTQEEWNEDSSGKSINAIRFFPGRGTLIWGARTLDGNSNEWRYIPVRRLFITIEESARKATAFAVFEPNDATTWLKVKGMLESYLYGLWERGALQGSKPEAAYYVNVGLGKTMTQDDVLNGRMIVEIGLAAVRPAEFIVLRFSHKLASA